MEGGHDRWNTSLGCGGHHDAGSDLVFIGFIGRIGFIGWIGFIGFIGWRIGFIVANIDLFRCAIRAEPHPAKAWIVGINERAPPPDTAVVPVAMAITVDDNAPAPLVVPVAVAVLVSASSVVPVAVAVFVSASSVVPVAVAVSSPRLA